MSAKRGVGRPSMKTPELLEQILVRLRNGESARSICRLDGFPSWATLCEWRMQDDEFAGQYARAKWLGMEAWADDIMDVCNDESRDVLETTVTYTDSKGNVTEKLERRSDNTAVNRDRLKVDSMKWIMCKLAPHMFGEKASLDLTTNGKDLLPALNITIEKKEQAPLILTEVTQRLVTENKDSHPEDTDKPE